MYLAIILFIFYFSLSIGWAKSGLIVFQSDFGLKDGAVSEVKGVMYGVDPSLTISDLTHEIPAYNIWEAAYRLYQAAPYWPKGTVFVSVVDPGVGTKRRSVVALTNDDHYVVTPDNGTLTLIADVFGIKEVREINEATNRLKGSEDSNTFYGRDVYGYTAAKLASGHTSFAEVGPVLHEPIVKMAYQKPSIKNDKLQGTIVTLDPQYGNVWTNVDKQLLEKYNLQPNQCYRVRIYQNHKNVFVGLLLYNKTFGKMPKGTDLLYLNSLLNLALATNQGNFAKKHHISSGPDWTITVKKSKKSKEHCNSEWIYLE